MPIDPNEAPEGYVAVAGHRESCLGCDRYNTLCRGAKLMRCCSEDRADGEEVIYKLRSPTSRKQPKPTVKLPQRYIVGDDSDGYSIEDQDPHGVWMRAEDVIAALTAAGIAWEKGT